MNNDFLDFLNQSPTPYHAVKNLSELFEKNGFQALSEKEEWNLVPGEAYYAIRSGSSCIAFVYGTESLNDGLKIMGTHTDSPCLKLKPQPEQLNNGYQQFDIELYGGVLLNPWFDRDLSLAGRVSWKSKEGGLQRSLVNFEKAIAVIPSLAIHLDREANSGRTIDPELHMKPIWQHAEAKVNFREYLKRHLQEKGFTVDKVLDFNLSFYDTQPGAVVGEKGEFIAGARLDNLLSTYVAARALLDSNRKRSAVLICNDHEEVGSQSDIGAQGTFLLDLLARLEPDAAARQRMLRNSVMFSVDNAHGIHPNYPNKHDKNHGPLLNAGPVLKFNANQSYATSSDSAALVRYIADSVEDAIPLQAFTVRAGTGCGSTIGPITAALAGVATVDLGVPTFAMHSIRELAGAKDTEYLFRLLQRFVNVEASLPTWQD